MSLDGVLAQTVAGWLLFLILAFKDAQFAVVPMVGHGGDLRSIADLDRGDRVGVGSLGRLQRFASGWGVSTQETVSRNRKKKLREGMAVGEGRFGCAGRSGSMERVLRVQNVQHQLTTGRMIRVYFPRSAK